jgi:hypothetical protein
LICSQKQFRNCPKPHSLGQIGPSRLFSAAGVFLGNAAVPLQAAKVNRVAMMRWWGEGTINTLHFLRGAF